MTRSLALTLAAVLALAAAASPGWAGHEIAVGLQCDRVGPTNTIGPFLCPGAHDYVKLVNKKGGVDGHRVRVIEIDIKYQVPLAVESYEKMKQEGIVSLMLYGTPQTYALTPKLTEDRIPGTAPGFGRADATDGTKYPYVFPVAASYWSQATAAVRFLLDESKKQGKKVGKVAFLFYDNPAGREPLQILETLARREGFELRTFAVPPPGIEMSAQVLDIGGRFRPDWVITHLFGRSPSVSIKELKRVGYPLDRVVSFVWGAAESDVEAAGWSTAEGYLGLQYAGVGQDFPVIQEIVKMYRDEGQAPPKEMAHSVYYNRGVLWAAVHVEAIRNAIKKFGPQIKGEHVKQGFEMIKGVTLGGLVPPLEITPNDHEGGGWVQVWQVKGGKWTRVTDWFKAYPDILQEALKKS
ncbi:MAG: ABC transporter substrate-binding protein [Candidatus Rokubacteria bacterium]|nr:ABC transporter substrate-binding protein [Candidatus Rokubacteria bacterium]